MAHELRAHAYLSASGSSRWMNCTPSAAFEADFPESRSTYADEGNLAHEIAEVMLKEALGIITKKSANKALNAFYHHELFYNDMVSEVQIYVDLCMEAYNTAKTVNGWAMAQPERKVSLEDYIEQGFGTVDWSIISGETLHIIDLKFGKGIVVSAHKNSQLMLYALGALREAQLFHSITKVKMTICQPRLEMMSEFEMTAEELVQWGETEVRERARMAYAGEGEFKPGDWCKFCRGKAKCRALAESKLAETKADFAIDPENHQAPTLNDLNTLTDEELVNIYAAKKQVEDWLESVKTYMVDQAENHGKEYPGYKLVDGVGRRAWVDEDQAAKALMKQGLPEDEIFKRKLIGIGAAEKLVGITVFQEVTKEVVTMKYASKSLVRNDVKRINSSTAKSDFS